MDREEIPADLADWLLSQYCTQIIDAVKAPSPAGDYIIRSFNNLPTQWKDLLEKRIRQLPR